MSGRYIGKLQLNSMLTVAFGLMFAALVQASQAGYVDFYKDANYKNKIGRVHDVVVDICYNLVCDNLRNIISSAKWGGLPDTGVMFEGGYNIIEFHTVKNCEDSDEHSWPIRTQSDDDLYFPLNFKQDGIDNAIKSFRAMDTGFMKQYSNVCTESAMLNATDDTFSKMSTDGIDFSSNNTAGDL